MQLSDIFTSRTRTRVLEILWRQECPLPVRRISDLAGIRVSVVARALKQLEKEGILSATARGNTLGYRLRREHEAYDMLCTVLRSAEERKRPTRSEAYDKIAQAALVFASETVEMFRTLHGRKPR